MLFVVSFFPACEFLFNYVLIAKHSAQCLIVDEFVSSGETEELQHQYSRQLGAQKQVRSNVLVVLVVFSLDYASNCTLQKLHFAL